MQYTVPDYYNEFSCIAGDCPDTCCAGWQIVIDEKSREKYKKYGKRGDAFAKRLRDSVDWKESVFYQKEKRCAFLNEENLCDLYKEAGPHMLCDTCRKFPRHVEEYEDLREISLSISCPVVADLLVNREEKVTFITKERPMCPEEYEEFDYMLFTKLYDTRELMIAILQSRDYDIRTRIAMVLALGHDLQRRVSRGQLFEIDDLLERYGRDGAIGRFEKCCEGCRCSEEGHRDLREGQGYNTRCEETLTAMYGLLDELEVLRDDFPRWRKERISFVLSNSSTELKGIAQEEAVVLEQLMVYFLYTYFCGAVYDGQAYGKVKFAVVSTLLIWELSLSDGNMTEAAYRYSKEVEHSDPNLIRMEELLLRRSKFALERLIEVIFGIL